MNFIKIYILSAEFFNNREIFNKAYQTLPKTRRDKIDRLKFNNDKILSLCAGCLLKYALDNENVTENRIFSENENGKPRLADYPDIHFNISHSENYCIVAVSNKNIGVDIEKIKNNYNSKIIRYFHPNEIDYYNNLSENEKQKEFFSLFTKKESYIKFIGTGLATPLNSFSVINNSLCHSIEFNNKYKLSYCSELNIIPEIIYPTELNI